MTSLRRLKKAVQWHDGMLLRPEHFQQADRRLDQLLHYQFSQALPFYWGVSQLKIDDVLLASGTVRILELEAVMPDGLVLSFHADDGDVLELNLADYEKDFKQGNQELVIYLCVPEYRSDAASLASEFPRYQSVESGFVINENTGEEVPRFPCLHPHANLVAGTQPSARYVSLPILKVQNVQSNYVLAKFTPPCLSVPLLTELGGLCTHIAQMIRNKAVFLADRVRSDQTSFMAVESNQHIRTMMAALLSFEAQLQTGRAHPYHLYLALCTLAGNLSGLRPHEIPPAFTPYDHNNILQSFTTVTNYILSCLNALQEGFTIVTFTQEDRVFKLAMVRDWVEEKFIFGAKASVDMQEKDLITWVTSAVIASKSYVSSVRDKRILGAKRRLIEGNEALKLMPSKDMVLFEVSYDRNFINPDEELQVFNVADTPLKRPRELIFYLAKAHIKDHSPNK
jgi:type VI secretion system protein ImpJ